MTLLSALVIILSFSFCHSVFEISHIFQEDIPIARVLLKKSFWWKKEFFFLQNWSCKTRSWTKTLFCMSLYRETTIIEIPWVLLEKLSKEILGKCLKKKWNSARVNFFGKSTSYRTSCLLFRKMYSELIVAGEKWNSRSGSIWIQIFLIWRFQNGHRNA